LRSLAVVNDVAGLPRTFQVLAMTLPLVVARHNSAEAISGMGKRLPRFARNDKREMAHNDKRKRARNDKREAAQKDTILSLRGA
jgi:hypothetical protein